MTASAFYPTLKGRVAIVTGSAQGLGRSFVRHFAEQGAIPVIAERNGEAAIALQKEPEGEGQRAPPGDRKGMDGSKPPVQEWTYHPVADIA